MTQESEEPLPKLPRAPLFRKLSLPALVRIGMFATLFYAVIVMRRPCAEGVARFVGNLDPAVDAGPLTPNERYPGFELYTAEELLKRFPDAPRDGGLDDGGSGDAGPLDAGPSDASSSRVP